ncbi:MAG: 6-bladed beta-propeller [Bacteroidales bacterium]|nr:6-bladed beta-propeller [Bacteroidales bacterium]
MVKIRSCLAIILGVLSICLASCKSGNSAAESSKAITIDIDEKDVSEFKLSELFSDFELLKLKSGDTPIGRINKFKIFNNKIYILSESKIFVYAESSELLSIIDKKGKGPGEYIGVSDFTTDKEGNIYIADISGKQILKYKVSGDFIDAWNTGFYFSGIDIYRDKYFLFTGNSNMNGEAGENMILGFNNWKDKVPEYKFLSIDRNIANYMNFLDVYNLREAQGRLLLGTSGFDTIYTITDQAIEPYYILNYLNGKIPRSALDKEFADVREFSEYFMKKGYSHYAFYYLDSPEFFFSRYNHAMKSYINVFDKKNNSSFNWDGIMDDIFLPNTKHEIYEFYPLAYHDSWYYFIYQPYKIINYLEKNGFGKIDLSKVSKEFLESINEDDNPIILKIK